MLTPQEVQERTFEKAVFGGYDMGEVDDFLDVLTEDYTNLYKENAVLKNKMKVLVRAVEEYREKEQSINSALQNAQRNADAIIANAQATAGTIAASAAAQAEIDAGRQAAQSQMEAVQAQIQAAKQAAREQLQAQQNALAEAKNSVADYVAAVRQALRREDELLAALLEKAPAPVEMPAVEEQTQPIPVVETPAPPPIVAEEPTIKLAQVHDEEDVAAEIERSVSRTIRQEDEAERQERKPKFEFIDLRFDKDYDL
ncbi:MAG: DivIVA domain-containing protein [Oscillospiraceae bacterium]|nr:DivIVA domain-containing protein [Oscillospiraceae bacterium]